MASAPIYLRDDDPGIGLDQLLLEDERKKYLSHILIAGGTVRDRLRRMSQEVHADYRGKSIHAICVLNGANTFFNDFRRFFEVFSGSNSVPMYFNYLSASSYDGTVSTGNVKLNLVKPQPLEGKHLVIFEDIIDTRQTMTAVVGKLWEYRPQSIKIVSLLEKRIPEEKIKGNINADYSGFSIPERFVVGYGLDVEEEFRDLPHICVMNQLGIDTFAKKK